MELETFMLLAMAAFLFAGTIKGLVGIGLPTATIAVLSQVMDPREAIALLLLPALVANAWQAYRGGFLGPRCLEFLPFAATLFVVIWAFALIAAQVPVDHLVLGIGCVIVLFVLTNLFSKPFHIPERLDRPAQVIAGGVSGAMGGLTSIWSPPMVIYLLGRKVPKDDFVGATGFIVLAGTVPLTIGYWQAGLTNATLAASSALMIVPTFLGFALGEKLRSYVNAEQFRYIVLAIFFLMGLNLIRKALI